ncbi:MAG: hypothetical protein KDA37_00375 [Planctomycetales bacterium]|nr:hypothetical protein [Planctomycetales bacterium]
MSAAARPLIQAAFCLGALGGCELPAQEVPGTAASVLSESQWKQIGRSADRGLGWLKTQQHGDGSFPSVEYGQPGVTSLCLLAYGCHGHLPGQGQHGQAMERAIQYILDCQKQSGLLARIAPDGPRLDRNVNHLVGSCSGYNHAISALSLSEFYGQVDGETNQQLHAAIEKAIKVTLEMQRWPKDRAEDKGGWRYLNDFDSDDSDVSITGWHLMFLRSAKNAGFEVPKESIDDAVAYIRRAYRPQSATFTYAHSPWYRRYFSRGVTGAGVLALAHSGTHETPEGQKAGEWLLKNGFDRYNHRPDELERYHYGLLTCTQAMYQLGGRYWSEFYPPTVKTVVANQRADGSWPRESHRRDSVYGEAYTTAICLITLGASNDLLPIFQR